MCQMLKWLVSTLLNAVSLSVLLQDRKSSSLSPLLKTNLTIWKKPSLWNRYANHARLSTLHLDLLYLSLLFPSRLSNHFKELHRTRFSNLCFLTSQANRLIDISCLKTGFLPFMLLLKTDPKLMHELAETWLATVIRNSLYLIFV